MALAIASYPTAALAACTSPAGAEGEMIYNDDFNVAQFCNGTSWVSMSGGASAGAESDPQVGMTTLNKWCRGDGSSVVCDLNAPLTTEIDPKIGALTASKWCMTNGTNVECTSDLPIGTLTASKWCTTNGTTISCTTDAPTATAGADTQVIFNTGGILTGDASFVWDNTNKRLGIGATGPSERLSVVGNLRVQDGSNSYGGKLVSTWNGGLEVAGLYGGSAIRFTETEGGTERMRIAASGNVGIGTTSPTNTLTLGTGGIGLGYATPTNTGGIGLGTDASSPSYNFSYTNSQGTYLMRHYGMTVLPNASPETYLAGYGGLGFITAGANRLHILSSGNVGIGTTSPSYKLDVVGNLNIAANTNKKVLVSELTAFPNISGVTATGASLGFSRASDGIQNIGGITLLNDAHLFLGTYNDLIFGSGAISTFNNAHERMRITSVGNVGIGTMSPAAKLDVSGHVNITNGPLDLSSGYPIRWGGVASSIYGGSGAADLVFTVGSAERLRINGSSGNVGIGTTGPNSRLEIYDAADASGGAFNNAAAFALRNPNSTNNNWVEMQFNGAGGAIAAGLGVQITDQAAYYGDIAMFTRGSGGWGERMRITSGGNVGIGTMSPGSYKLYVAGNAWTTGTWGSSDARWKENVHSLHGGLSTAMALKPVTFTWLAGTVPAASDRSQQVGLIAQEVEKVIPQLVRTNDDGFKAVAYDKLSVVAIQAIQELKAANDNLRAAIEEQGRQIEALKTAQHKGQGNGMD